MPINWWMYLLAGLIPLLVGMLWYSKILFGDKWMNLNGLTEDQLKNGNPLVLFSLSYLFSVLIAFAFGGIAIHQSSVFQMMMPDVLVPGSEAAAQFTDLMSKYGHYHRSFSHGAIHGIVFTLFFILPFVAINALFERRGWTYIMIHVGYWAVSLILIGGLLCSTLKWAPIF